MRLETVSSFILTAITAAGASKSIHGKLCAYVSWTDTRDVDLLAGHLSSQRVGKCLQSVLRGGVCSSLRDGKLSLHRANKANVANLTFYHRR